MSNLTEQPRLIVVSAPSGAGKTTLCRMLLDEYKNVHSSVSVTTREQRPQEIEGKHYYFVSLERFREMDAAGEFAESALVHGNYYGTPKSHIEQCIQEQTHILFDIDIQGARSLRDLYPTRVLLIFIVPPSIETLQKRLVARKGDGPKSIERRIQNAYNELEWSRIFQYQITNDDLTRAYGELREIFQKECR